MVSSAKQTSIEWFSVSLSTINRHGHGRPGQSGGTSASGNDKLIHSAISGTSGACAGIRGGPEPPRIEVTSSLARVSRAIAFVFGAAWELVIASATKGALSAWIASAPASWMWRCSLRGRRVLTALFQIGSLSHHVITPTDVGLDCEQDAGADR
jgi:hypothetical protein